MRTVASITSVALLALLAGCPLSGPLPVPVLAGDWTFTTPDGTEEVHTFNFIGMLVSIKATNAAGVSVTESISGAVSTLNGDQVTVRIPTGEGDIVFSGTLSADENTIEGTLSREFTLGQGGVTVTIPSGDVTLSRVVADGDTSEATSFTATLDGDQETDVVTTDGSGSGTFTLSADMMELEFAVTASGLTGPAMAAHFHNAPAGVAGGVVFGLGTFLVEMDGMITISGTTQLADWTIANAAEELLAGNIYVNIHTTQFAPGEIRGQLMPAMEDNGQ